MPAAAWGSDGAQLLRDSGDTNSSSAELAAPQQPQQLKHQQLDLPMPQQHQLPAHQHQQQQQQPSSGVVGLLWDSGVACVLTAAVVFSVANLLVKLTDGRVPVLEITLLRSVISLTVSLVIIKLRRVSPPLGHISNLKWLIPRGVFGALAMCLFYAAIILLPLADGVTLFFLNPTLTAVAAWAFRGERLSWQGWLGVCCSMVGMVVLTHPPMLFGGHKQWGRQRIVGTTCGLASAVFCAGAFLSIRFLGKQEPSLVIALYFHMCTTLLSAVPLSLGFPQAPVLLTWSEVGLLLGVAACSFFGQLFLTRAMQLENAGMISSLNFSQVIWSSLLGIVALHEHLSLFGVLGSLLVATGIVGVTVKPQGEAAAGAEQQQGRQAACVEEDQDPSRMRLLSSGQLSSGRLSSCALLSQSTELASLPSSRLPSIITPSASLTALRQPSDGITPQLLLPHQAAHALPAAAAADNGALSATALPAAAAAAGGAESGTPPVQQQQHQHHQRQDLISHMPAEVSATHAQHRQHHQY